MKQCFACGARQAELLGCAGNRRRLDFALRRSDASAAEGHVGQCAGAHRRRLLARHRVCDEAASAACHADRGAAADAAVLHNRFALRPPHHRVLRRCRRRRGSALGRCGRIDAGNAARCSRALGVGTAARHNTLESRCVPSAHVIVPRASVTRMPCTDSHALNTRERC